MSLARLLAKIEQYYPNFDRELVERAYLFAKEAHRGQFRNSGEAFIEHPLQVACILADLQLDITSIVAGLLHDVVEDTNTSLQDIETDFGPEVRFLVAGVTKLGKIEYKSKEDRHAENLRKMFLAMARDIRVILIKLADRLHNLRTLGAHEVPKQREIARETLEIFAPVAHRLGIYKIKWEMEDLAFRYLEPDKYYELADRIAKKRKEREDYINLVITKLREKLTEAGIKAEISGRPKNFYSIYRKMVDQGKDLSEIYDLVAVRVIVETVKECYATLGIVHTMWKPIPGRFKDYIAMPKQNMYQSLHTTLVGPLGEPFELQIRTFEMHRTAEYGIAAHWRYKEGGRLNDPEFEKKLSWLRQILEWQHELRDAREFMESLKIDLFSDVVFVFTPKGDVVELPSGSVPIDFAYRIHTEVGHRCIGAKVNGRIVPLDYRLKNGDIVEILTSKQSGGPSRDWLSIVKTSQAKNRIRQWYKKEKKEDNILRGRELLEKELRRQGYDSSSFYKLEGKDAICQRLGFQTENDLYAGIGDGTISPLSVIAKVRDELRKKEEPPELPAAEKEPGFLVKVPEKRAPVSTGVRVRGVKNLAVHLSHCCNPLPGDQIIGYITRGRGVSVHRVDCPNIAYHFQGERERMIDVSWEEDVPTTYQVEIEVKALDRPHLTTDIMNTIADTRTVINAVNARAKKNKMALVNLKLEIRDIEHLYTVMQKVSRVSDVLEVHRVVPK
ncbi:GTP pyrophosphokinase RelA [Thermacetogenium phaeum DSM 12270]|uniref:GTP diphosphokinase n=2 Tax=Thermacetogenium phaeum TaxID=85874 RepID=K4LHB7_THEPS|nr:bifunctional (p)ppGpp synthetase/guanosine-3',5'-bis(diphosphate) 3'-pyrophosphohydrolase [Thermacetogenium phaeum]AFV11467.1 GTP pyrophosphokinase RelA [Thermacetogenium phaeum DSM 12270]